VIKAEPRIHHRPKIPNSASSVLVRIRTIASYKREALPLSGRRKDTRLKFVSVTNGDIGHWKEKGRALASRRKLEVENAAKILGITVAVLDNHDGELLPDPRESAEDYAPDSRLEG
jgi:LmbE family N-acetylglucosaminyl deacetylase